MIAPSIANIFSLGVHTLGCNLSDTTGQSNKNFWLKKTVETHWHYPSSKLPYQKQFPAIGLISFMNIYCIVQRKVISTTIYRVCEYLHIKENKRNKKKRRCYAFTLTREYWKEMRHSRRNPSVSTTFWRMNFLLAKAIVIVLSTSAIESFRIYTLWGQVASYKW